jgi:hypothetical protein
MTKQKKIVIKSKKEAIAMIDKSGKRQEFVDGWGRTPEEYFDEYVYKEPDIWYGVLFDLRIIK